MLLRSLYFLVKLGGEEEDAIMISKKEVEDTIMISRKALYSSSGPSICSGAKHSEEASILFVPCHIN